jgi:methionyl-tRNA formyltransferase
MARTKSGRVYIDDFAARHGIEVAKIRDLNKPEAVEIIREAGLDWLFIIGWSQIARAEVLSTPSWGVIGMHPTLLPQGRGRAAIPWAILKGINRTGVTMFRLDEGVDTGPILAQVEIPLHDRIDASELYTLVDRAHVALMREAFPKLARGELDAIPQDHSQATEWPRRKPEDGAIDPHGSVREASPGGLRFKQSMKRSVSMRKHSSFRSGTAATGISSTFSNR